MATNSSLLPKLAPLDALNQTTAEWRVDPLSTNVTAVNGTLMNGTLIDGKPYNGIPINGTAIIELVQSSTIGTLPLISFIYMIMSIVIILFVASSFMRWIWAATSRTTYKYVENLQGRGGMTTMDFNREMRRYYKAPGQLPANALPSYAETISGNPNGDFGPEALRDFRELIRSKYKLDCDIWNYRNAPPANRHLLDEMRRQSEAAVYEMRRIADHWVETKGQWSADDLAQVEEIRARLG